MRVRLVLWDIDHTLLATRGVGRELAAVAFEQVTGTVMREQAKVEGVTEPVIFRETAALHGLATGRAEFEAYAAALAQVHRERFAALRERGHALEGAAAALEALAAQPEVRQTVVTGNVRAVAEVKLQAFGLDRHIDWNCGAFGEDGDERDELVRAALTRASECIGQEVIPSDAVLIGDTPADVEGANAVRVPVIAVASGRSTTADLTAAGAQTVLPDLRNTQQLIALVAGGAN